MFGSEIVDSALAIVFILAFVTLFATAVKETIEAALKNRSKDLERGIRELLGGDEDMLRRLYEHPLISSLFPGSYKPGLRTLPTYIPSANFAAALLDLLSGDGDADLLGALKTGDGQGVCASLDRIENEHIRCVLQSAYHHAQGDLATTRSYLEDRFDDAMDMVSGWYRSRAQKILFAIGFVSAALFNIDLYQIGTDTMVDSTLHESFAGYFQGVVPVQDPGLLDIEKMQAQLREIEAPIGWDPPPQQVCVDAVNGDTECGIPPWALLTMITSWLVIGFSTTLGAPFWFDALNKVMVLRSTVKPREKSRPEGSEDRR